MSFIRTLSYCVGMVFAINLNAQENLTGFWQPQAALDYDVTPTYGHNISIAYRSFFLQEEAFDFSSRQLDLVHFSKFTLKDNQSIALGVQYRLRDIFEDASNELRFTQQFNVTYRPLTIRYGHRFRSEQRITRDLTIHRFRYRFAMDFPLSGQKLNIGEPYFVGNIEQLLSLAQSRSPQYDFRINSQIGWQLNTGLKFQMGLEYRFEEFTASQIEHIVFLLTSVQLSI